MKLVFGLNAMYGRLAWYVPLAGSLFPLAESHHYNFVF